MEKESDSWFPYQQFELPPSNSNFSGSPALRGQLPALMSPYTKGVCAYGAPPIATYSGLPVSEAKQPIEHYNWFYDIPSFRQTFASPLANEKLASSDQIDNYGVNRNGKQFLVFDKSGDQTSLIYSCGIRTPINFSTSWNPNPRTSCTVIKEEFLLKENENPKVFSRFQNLDRCSQEYPADLMKNQSSDRIRCISPGTIAPEGGVIEEEMHEDTEELNALLYSDDENDYSEDDDDVTSTGHSPSTMIDPVIHHLTENDDEEDEEVASSACSFKRYKLLDGAYDVPPLVHVAAIKKKKPFKSCDLDSDDAESYCSDFDNQVSGDSSLSGKKKRSRSENIRTKLSILQNIIPGAKGKKKTPTVVIDEAVQYLKFLKDRAKSFGFHSP